MSPLPEVEIGSVCTLINGYAFKPTDWGKSGLPIVRIQNLNDPDCGFNYFDGQMKEQFLIDSGELLFSWSGTPGTSFGAFFWYRGKAVLNQHIFRVLVDENKVDKGYFRYALNYRIDRIIAQSHGGVGLKHITKGKLEATKVPLPPLEEQRRIAAILDKADAVRRKRKEAIALTEELLHSAFLDMFGDPVANPKGWEVVTVGDLVSEVRDGPHVSPEYSESGVPILSTRNIRPGRLILEDVKYISNETYEKLVKQFKPQYGDVLLTKGGTTGFAKVVDWNWPFAIWVHLAALRPKSVIQPEFLEAALNSPSCYKQSLRYTHGIANKDLGLTRIRKIKLSLPPIDLQHKYCLLRQKMLDKLSSQEKSFIESEHLFNSLLQRAFRGEI